MDSEQTESLKLAPPANLTGTTGWIARELGVSPQAIRNWHDGGKGMPACGVDPKRGGPLFDRAVCLEWQRKNRPATLHGGVRRGPGRKPAKSPGEMVPALASADCAAMNRQTAEQIRTDVTALKLEPPETRQPMDGLFNLTAAQINVLAREDPAVTNFTLTQATREQQLTKLARDQMEIAKERGELMDRSEQLVVLTGLMETARGAFESLAGKLTPALMSAMRLTPDREAPMRAIIEREVGRVVGEMERLGKKIAGDDEEAGGAGKKAA